MADKPVEPDDPLALVGVALPGGDLELMAECLVGEYVRLGMGDGQLLALFRNPFYAGAHAIWRLRGETYVQGLIERVREQWGRPRFTVVHGGPPPAGDA